MGNVVSDRLPNDSLDPSPPHSATRGLRLIDVINKAVSNQAVGTLKLLVPVTTFSSAGQVGLSPGLNGPFFYIELISGTHAPGEFYMRAIPAIKLVSS